MRYLIGAPAIRVTTVFVAVCLQAALLPAQEFPPEVAQRRRAVGTLKGTVSGTRHEVSYAGDTVDETLDCTLNLTFYANGTMYFEAGQYKDVHTYIKKIQNGEIKTVTTYDAEPAKGTKDTSLSIWVTPSGLVQNATWQGTVQVPATVTTVTWVRGSTPTAKWQRNGVPTTKTLLVYCEPRVYWRGANNRGPGLPLSGSGSWPDVIRRRPWITDTAQWSFQVLQ